MEELLHLENFIGGEFFKTERYLDSYEPATGRVWAKVPDSEAMDVHRAVLAAKNAFPVWSCIGTAERATYMTKIADILESRLEEFAIAEARDQGKTISLAKTVDIPRAVLNFRHFANTASHLLDSSKVQPESNVVNYTVRSPIGVAGLISPWNLPLYLLTFKIAPAIAHGNTVVCKPSEFTSVTAWMLCSVFKEAGLPAGVVNMVFGLGGRAGHALVCHEDVALISFTGGTETGRRINTTAAEDFKKVSLEMGGKNAGIVFEDADIDKCVVSSLRSSFMNQGEVCLCTSRIYVQRSIYPQFMQKFTEAAKKIKVGPSLSKDSEMGALISKEHVEKVRSYIRLAKQENATIHTGSEERLVLDGDYKNGYFLAPCVISGLKDKSRCMQEEIFGPVVVIEPFDTEEEAVQRANNVKYGLCASVWSNDVNKIHRVAHKLQVGTVWCNSWLIRCLDMPFGGVKQSGIGREGTHESAEFFTEVKTVCIKLH